MIFTNYFEALRYAESHSRGDIFYSVEFIELDKFKVIRQRLNDDLKGL